MEKFIGKWEVTTTENMDEMLKAFGKSFTYNLKVYNFVLEFSYGKCSFVGHKFMFKIFLISDI